MYVFVGEKQFINQLVANLLNKKMKKKKHKNQIR